MIERRVKTGFLICVAQFLFHNRFSTEFWIILPNTAHTYLFIDLHLSINSRFYRRVSE